MDVRFESRSMQKACSSEKQMGKRWGEARARKLRQRLAELAAAETLEDLRGLPGARCHELRGDRKGQLSVDLVDPYRLIFNPDKDPLPRKPEGGLDWKQVTAVLVVEVADTH